MFFKNNYVCEVNNSQVLISSEAINHNKDIHENIMVEILYNF